VPIYRKLVRDKIPEQIRATGRRCEVRVLKPDAYREALAAKLREECEEYWAERTVDELVDVVEVVRALLAVDGWSWDQFEHRRLAKLAERGGFSGRVWLESVSD
jgi:predicted house-cleaning noncanonical NTP pyrophosphatase (MazG superfamily)